MAIPPIGPTTGLGPVGGLGKAAPSKQATGDFGDVVVKALDSLQVLQDKADGLALQAATGDLTDVHDYMIAATEASLATEMTVAVRNRAVESFNEIMRMQV